MQDNLKSTDTHRNAFLDLHAHKHTHTHTEHSGTLVWTIKCFSFIFVILANHIYHFIILGVYHKKQLVPCNLTRRVSCSIFLPTLPLLLCTCGLMKNENHDFPLSLSFYSQGDVFPSFELTFFMLLQFHAMFKYVRQFNLATKWLLPTEKGGYVGEKIVTYYTTDMR